MRSGLIWFGPFICFPVHLPSTRTHTFLSFPFTSLMPSCSVISLLFFFCAHTGPALSVYTRTRTFQTGIRWPRYLTKEVGLIGCPCALGFPSIAITYYLGLVSSSSHVFTFCPSSAQMCTLVSFLPFFLPGGHKFGEANGPLPSSFLEFFTLSSLPSRTFHQRLDLKKGSLPPSTGGVCVCAHPCFQGHYSSNFYYFCPQTRSNVQKLSRGHRRG